MIHAYKSKKPILAMKNMFEGKTVFKSEGHTTFSLNHNSIKKLMLISV